jgi:hypothetical protein
MIEDLLRPQHLLLIFAIVIVFSLTVIVAGSAVAFTRYLFRRMVPRERSR